MKRPSSNIIVSLTTLIILILFSLQDFDLSVTSSINTTVDSSTATTSERLESTIPLHIISADHPYLNLTNADPVVTIVVQLTGELGNQLQKLGNGFCIQHHIENELGFKTQIKLRAQVWAGKWRHAMQWSKAAFPVLAPYDFKEYNTPKFDNSQTFQEKWIDTLIDNGKLNITNITNPRMLTDGNAILDRFTMDDLLNLLNQTWHLDWPTVPDSKDMNNNSTKTIHTPHVYSEQMMSDYCLDTIYHKLRNFFQLDEETNCKLIPEVNETVLHLRNFIAEMPRRGKGLGFEELDPIRTASELFANHQSGDKVAIISRLDNNIDKYKEALEMRGLKVRYVEQQTGNEDFCFLIKAQKEIIGQTRSTYAYWASILGNMKHARLYSVDTPNTRRQGVHYYSYNFTNKQLKNRIIYENYS